MQPPSQYSKTSRRRSSAFRAVWQMATTEERNRLAQEIHDTLAQAFLAILIQADELESSLGTDSTRGELIITRIQELARTGLDETRRAVRGLRPKALEKRNLTDALEHATQNLWRDDELACTFNLIGKPRKLPEDTEDELYRIAQEAMTNVKKHAMARAARVTLEFHPDKVILMIRDHGAGFPINRSSERACGHGLSIMRDRAHRIGGRLDLANPSDGGVAIRVTVSLEKTPNRLYRHRARRLTAVGAGRAPGLSK